MIYVTAPNRYIYAYIIYFLKIKNAKYRLIRPKNMSDIKIPCSNLDTLKSYLLCVPAEASGNAPAPLL